MPVSHRVGASFSGHTAQPALSRARTAARSANSSTLVIAVATTFALLSALASLMPETAPGTPDDLASARLRGSLPALGETTAR